MAEGHDDLVARWGLEQGFLWSEAVRLHYVAGGSGRLVLLLHGFPEFWYSWRHQLLDLRRDYRVVALDLRGYNDSDKPAGRGQYGLRSLAKDVVAAIDHFGEERAVIIGHDWGGIIGWVLSTSFSDRLDGLIILNAPHPVRYLQELRRPAQLRKSWYVFFFQLPHLPERLMTRRAAAAVAPHYRRLAANPEAFSEQDITIIRDAFLRPGVATAAINYYRNVFGALPLVLHGSSSAVRTLLIWGDRDPYLGHRLSEGVERYVADLTVRHVADAGHFVHQERPAQVNREIRNFLALSDQVYGQL